jgi:hypothetical protein
MVVNQVTSLQTKGRVLTLAVHTLRLGVGAVVRDGWMDAFFHLL